MANVAAVDSAVAGAAPIVVDVAVGAAAAGDLAARLKQQT